MAPILMVQTQCGQETNTSVSSRMTKNTGKGPTLGQMEANTSVNTGMAKRMNMAPTLMVQSQSGQETNT